jgi:hypothetical protein
MFGSKIVQMLENKRKQNPKRNSKTEQPTFEKHKCTNTYQGGEVTLSHEFVSPTESVGTLELRSAIVRP